MIFLSLSLQNGIRDRERGMNIFLIKNKKTGYILFVVVVSSKINGTLILLLIIILTKTELRGAL